MIVLDTHIWVWWVDASEKLPPRYIDELQARQAGGLGVSAISCWEVAKLVERGRLVLRCSAESWLEGALSDPVVRLLELTPAICVESTQLPGDFHQDPADQIIVATARIHGCPLMSVDAKIRAYPHVEKAP